MATWNQNAEEICVLRNQCDSSDPDESLRFCVCKGLLRGFC